MKQETKQNKQDTQTSVSTEQEKPQAKAEKQEGAPIQMDTEEAIQSQKSENIPEATAPESIPGNNATDQTQEPAEKPDQKTSDDSEPENTAHESKKESPHAPKKEKKPAIPIPKGMAADKIVEALIFSTSRPISSGKLCSIVKGVTPARLQKIVKQLNSEYEKTGRPFRINEIASGFRMYTIPEYAPWVQQLHKPVKHRKLTPAAIETLSIIAYKQPITKAEVESVRGVSCGQLIRTLMESGLVFVKGKSSEVGAPNLYATTDTFLEEFGLKSLDDLPRPDELLDN